MSETSIKRRVLAELRTLPDVWCFKVHGGGVYQQAGLPDVIGVCRGRFFGLEIKVPGEEATKLQDRTLGEIRAAGGIGAVVTSPQEAIAALEAP